MIPLQVSAFAWLTARGSVSSDSDCFMRPPPLEVSQVASLKAVKSFTVDADKLGASVLMKDGSIIRILNEGCEHSGTDVVLWLPTLSPLKFDTKALVEKVKLAAKIGFRTIEEPGFAIWIDGARFAEQADGSLVAEGSRGSISYSAEFKADFHTTGTVVRVSYSYN